MRESAPTHWKLDHVDEIENMVFLVSDDIPVINKFGSPQTVVNAFVQDDYVLMTCVDGTVWAVRISDGACWREPLAYQQGRMVSHRCRAGIRHGQHDIGDFHHLGFLAVLARQLYC